MRKAWLLFLLFLLASSVKAENSTAPSILFEEYSIESAPQDGDLLRENITLYLRNVGTTNVTKLVYALPYGARNVSVALSDDTMAEIGERNVTFLTNLLPGNATVVSLSFVASGFIFDAPPGKLFIADFTMPTNVSRFSFALLLPPGYGETSNKTQQLITPPTIYSSDGRRIYLVWYRYNLHQREMAHISTRYEMLVEPETTTTFIERTIKQTEFPVYILILAFVLGAVFALWFFGPSIRKFRRATMKLNDDEKKVVDALERKGPTQQSELQRMTDFSKAKLSRLLRQMEERNLVRKESKGKINVISLK
jgi:uncharacterized membrane protein